MALIKPIHEDSIYTREPTARIRLAIQAYESGAVKTKKEAAALAGVDYQYFCNVSNHSVPAKAMGTRIAQMIEDETIETSKILTKLGRKALGKINHIMENADSESLRLRAATDLADRSPETSRTQKHVVTSLTLEGKDVAAITAALAESREINVEYADLAEGDFVKVDTDHTVDMSALDESAGHSESR